MRENSKHLDGDRRLTAAIKENVLVQLARLKTLPAVAGGLSRRDMHMHGWVYKIKSGDVFASDLADGRFARYDEGAKSVRIRMANARATSRQISEPARAASWAIFSAATARDSPVAASCRSES